MREVIFCWALSIVLLGYIRGLKADSQPEPLWETLVLMAVAPAAVLLAAGLIFGDFARQRMEK